MDLRKIVDSGQCFRPAEVVPGIYRFITGDNIIYLKEDNSVIEGIWQDYFDMDRDYAKIRSQIPENDEYMQAAAKCGEGIRILRQDPWEMIISFIISQRKSIPAIRSSIEMLCESFGEMMTTEYETIYTFPSAAMIADKTLKGSGTGNLPRETLFEALMESKLKDCKLGYRLRYICDAVCRVIYGEIDLDSLYNLDSEELLLKLKEINGVGDKVANCIALFAYSRCELAPVDTWIKKVIDGVYGGINPFPQYGDVAGIMQQYIFYYALTHKEEF